VVNNAELHHWPAHIMAAGGGWHEKNPFYYDRSLAEKQLGCGGAGLVKFSEAIHKVEVKQPGKYNLWLRCSPHPNGAIMEVRQKGEVLASRQIEDKEPKLDNPTGFTSQWISMPVELASGEIEVVLRNNGGGSERRYDYFALTNYLDYTPVTLGSDFRPQGYIRFTNHSEGAYGLWFRGLAGGAHGMIGRFGVNLHAPSIGGSSGWLQPGESSPWIRVSDNMPTWDSQVTVIATNGGYQNGEHFYKGRFVGDLDFAWGPDYTITKTIKINQDAPKLVMTMPFDFKNQIDRFITAHDHLRGAQEAVKDLPENPKRPQRIKLTCSINMHEGADDSALMKGEIGVLKKLGMNALYDNIASPDKNTEVVKGYDMLPFTRIWASSVYYQGYKAFAGDEKVEASAAGAAKHYANVLDQVSVINTFDEPYGQDWNEMLKHPEANGKFIEYLKARNYTLEKLGCKAWEEVRLVGPQERDQFPVLHYYSGLYRLQVFGDWMAKVTEIWHKHFPQTALTYPNLEPTYAHTADHIGYDFYSMLRSKPFDLLWSEDWKGYGVGSQQTLDYLELMTSANRTAQLPLGGYVITVELRNVNPYLTRLKAYTWLSYGATILSFYNYGPQYCAGDAWSYSHQLYKPLATISPDVAEFEVPLEKCKPRPAKVAVLFNRCAGIWRDWAKPTELNCRFTMWALNERGYNAEFIWDEEIEEGILSKFQVLYIDGVNVPAKAAAIIAKWVQDGGVIVGTTAAGTRDEFNKPMETLEPVFGVKSSDAAHPKEGAWSWSDKVTTTKAYPYPELTLTRLALTETLTPTPAAKVILSGETGPAGTLHAYGKGQAVRLAALPAFAYVHEATSQKNDGYLLPGTRTEAAQFVAWPAELAGVQKVGEVDYGNAPKIVLKRWDSQEGSTPDTSVVFVIDWTCEPNESFAVTLPDAAHFTKIRSAHGAKVTVTRDAQGKTRVAFPLNMADVIILEK